VADPRADGAFQGGVDAGEQAGGVSHAGPPRPGRKPHATTSPSCWRPARPCHRIWTTSRPCGARPSCAWST
jgi:hypothetical protein